MNHRDPSTFLYRLGLYGTHIALAFIIVGAWWWAPTYVSVGVSVGALAWLAVDLYRMTPRRCAYCRRKPAWPFPVIGRWKRRPWWNVWAAPLGEVVWVCEQDVGAYVRSFLRPPGG